MVNVLAPGGAGLPAPSPQDQAAVPPDAGPALVMPMPGPTEMQQHYASAEDKAGLAFGQVREAQEKISTVRRELDKLLAYGDTVTMDNVVDAAGGLVAAGIPAVQVATTLADCPDGPGQLEAWVREQSDRLVPQEQKMAQLMKQAGFNLGLTAFRSLMAHSAEDHFVKTKLAATQIPGRAN